MAASCRCYIGLAMAATYSQGFRDATGPIGVTTRSALAVDDSGQGPAVVLVHGLGGWRDVWATCAVALRAAGHRVIAYDQRGHGDSADVDPPWSITDLADDLLAVLDTAGLARACIVGHSMGGRAMFDFVLRHPERVSGIVAVGAHSEAPRPPYRAVLETVREAASRSGVPGFRRAFEEAGEIPDRVTHDAAFAAWFEERFSRNRPAMIVAALDAILSMPTLTGRLNEIRRPMLSVVGERDLNFLELAGHYAEVVAGCRTEVLPGCAHYPMVDAPDAFVDVLLAFLHAAEP